jgi:outer membrane lipoprotein carrier protein
MSIMRVALASLGLAALGLLIVGSSNGSLAASAAGQTGPAPGDLARRIQAHYDTVKDFTSDFTQHYAGGFLPQETDDRGTLTVKKPGMMRWTYATGEKQEYVTDGVRSYSYFPKNKHGTEAPLPKGDDTSTAVLFLAGRGDLTRDFTTAMSGTQPPGEWRLTLTPKKPQSDFVSLTLIVDRAALKLAGLIKTDAQQTVTTFRFPNLKENTGVPASKFAFQFPSGTQVDR